MNRLKKSALAAVAMLLMSASFALAQGPLQKRINYSINVPYSLRMGDYTMAPGNYILYQVSFYDPSTFALYANDMRHSPVAMIRTTRIDYAAGRYPRHTKMLLDIDESTNDPVPIIRGFTIPGEDGWEIIAVVAKDNHYMTRVK